MPALIAHNIFGHDVLAKLAGELDLGVEARQAFLLGCQGPDPYFFTIKTPNIKKRHKFASDLHKQKVQESFGCLLSAARVVPEGRRQAMEAYAQGWLCHFTLDSQAHPYIIYLEQSYTTAGVAGLGEEARHEVHSQIEADLDCMMLFTKTGRTIKSYRPATEVLSGTDSLLEWIGVMYRRVAADVFRYKIPASAFARGVQDMRAVYDFIYSPNGIKRMLIGYAERAFRAHSMAEASSHRLIATDTCDFDNHQNQPWVNPFTLEQSTASFLDIYNASVDLAAQRIRWCMHDEPVAKLVGNLNFQGEIYQDC